MRKGLALAAGAAGAAGAFWAWTRAGRRPPSREVAPRIEEHLLVGDDEGAGSLVAVQPSVEAADYATADRLLEKLDAYLAHARERGALSAKSVVVFPEHIGTWLFAVDEKRAVYESADLERASALVVARNLPTFLRHFARARGADGAAVALFRTKARAMAAAYEHVFSTLARRYGVTVVAGSVVLPAPRVEGGRLLLDDGPLTHASFVFTPEGSLHERPVRKCMLGHDERGFLEPGLTFDLPSFETPAGRLGVLVGRDAFYPTACGALYERRVELLAVPAYLAAEQAWTRPWGGYGPSDLPPDVEPSDVGRLLEAEAWLRYGPPMRLAQCGARAQATAFLKGHVWDRVHDGAALVTAGGETAPGPLVQSGSWVCRFLPRAP